MGVPKKKYRWQTHVYLCEDDFVRLREIAEKESRSTTMQIEFFLRKAIAEYAALAHDGKERG
jgi:hypothetical protein